MLTPIWGLQSQADMSDHFEQPLVVMAAVYFWRMARITNFTPGPCATHVRPGAPRPFQSQHADAAPRMGLQGPVRRFGRLASPSTPGRRISGGRRSRVVVPLPPQPFQIGLIGYPGRFSTTAGQ